MSDHDSAPIDEVEVEDEAPELLTAELVRGVVYFLGDIRFDCGCQVVIHGHHRDHLEEHAVEKVGDDDGELQVKDKFMFRPYSGKVAVGQIASGKPKDPVDTRDVDKEARLRAFAEAEKKRKSVSGGEEPKKFDKDASRAAIERSGTGRDDGLPKARPARHRPSRQA